MRSNHSVGRPYAGTWSAIALSGLALLVAGCGTAGEVAPIEDGAPQDVVDVAAGDAVGETETDGAVVDVPDAGADAEPEADAPDVAADADVHDTAVDTAEVISDAAAEVIADAVAEISEDAAEDAGADAAGDVLEEVATCVDACPNAGTTECAGDGVHSCVVDAVTGCLVWGAVVDCTGGQVCVGGSCVPVAPATVLVNEVRYDVPGGDDVAGTGAFVELWGPPGLALDGYAVVGVNGSNGSDYATISLDGHVLGADGYFVIAHPKAAAGLLDAADLLSSAVDLQNGPDSVQVRVGGVVVDALAYGTFAAGDFLAGEGQPAAEPEVSESLGRDAAHTDTGDNAADFAAQVPSPGGAPVACVDVCPSMGATQCEGTGAVATCAPGGAGGCLVWGAAVACPEGQLCTGGVCAPPPCEDGCPANGEVQCLGDAVQTCGAGFDADACLEWGPAVGCAAGYVCVPESGACELPGLDNYLWNVHAGGDKNDWAIAAAMDASGEAVVGGIFTGPMQLGDTQLTFGLTDIFLTRVGTGGEVLWARDIGGGGVEQLTDLALAANGDVVFTGWFDGSTTIGTTALSNANGSYDVLLARYSAAGDFVWAMKIGGDGDNEGLGVATDAADHIYLAGTYHQAFPLSSVYGLAGNAFVAKLDGAGGVLWSFGIGGPQVDRANDVAVDAAGNVVVTGSVGGLVDFDPGAGEAMGGPGLFVAKYDASGKYLWHYVRSGVGYRVAVDAAGDAYVVGVTTASVNLGGGTHQHAGGSTDGFLVKLSANGAYMWSTHLGSLGADALRDVSVDPLGNVFVTGEYGGDATWEGTALPYEAANGSLKEDVVVARFGPGGQVGWVGRFGGPGAEHGRAIAAGPDGRVVWAGDFGESVALNEDLMTSAGLGDLAIVGFTATSDGSAGCFADGPICAPQGACTDLDDVPVCTCEVGYAGPSCAECAVGFEADGDACVSVCAGTACAAHQHCEGGSGAPVCVCDTGWTGAACDTCAAGYAKPSGCFGAACECLPDCGTTAPVGACATCAGAKALWPGVGSLSGFLVGDGNDAMGGCGGAGPDHALTFHLAEPTLVELELVTTAAVLYVRRSCADPETQLACDAASGSSTATVAELLPPGDYTVWLDTQDGTGSTYTLHYSFAAAP